MTDLPTCDTCTDKDDCDNYKSTAVRDVSRRCGLLCHPKAKEYMMKEACENCSRPDNDTCNECAKQNFDGG